MLPLHIECNKHIQIMQPRWNRKSPGAASWSLLMNAMLNDIYDK